MHWHRQTPIQIVCLCALFALQSNLASAQSGSAKSGAKPPGNPPAKPASLSSTLPPEIIEQVTREQARDSFQWLATKASKHVPRTISGDDNWGNTQRVWAGVKMRMDGLKLRTHRRFRELEQGRWIKYEVTLPDVPPVIRITEASPITDRATGEQSWNITSSIVTPLEFTARIQRWNLGVRLFSVTINGRARIRLNSSVAVSFRANYGEIPPGLVVVPHVSKAELVMEHFEVDQISKIGGEVAEQWGELMEDLLVERLVKRQNEKLVSNLNRSIEKERDDLKLSLSVWFEKWSGHGPSGNVPHPATPDRSESPSSGSPSPGSPSTGSPSPGQPNPPQALAN